MNAFARNMVEPFGDLFKVLTVMGEQGSSTLTTPFGFIRVPGKLSMIPSRAWFNVANEKGL